MKAEMRSTMQAAARVQIFNGAHPVTDPGATLVIADFDQRVARADAQVTQQAESAARSIAANRARRIVRKRLGEGLLRLFVGFFELVTDEIPDLRGIKVPKLRSPDPTFLLAAERIITAATTHREALTRFGLSEALLDEATGLLDEFRTISAEAKEAYQARVEASKALHAVRLEIHAAIQRLDRLNRHRFADQPDVLAGWDTARNVVARSRARQDAPGTDPAAGTEGGVADAA